MKTSTWRRLREGDPLTAREEQVRALIARGFTNAEVAQQIRIHRVTASGYASALCRKLGASTRAELAVRAYQVEQEALVARLERALNGAAARPLARLEDIVEQVERERIRSKQWMP